MHPWGSRRRPNAASPPARRWPRRGRHAPGASPATGRSAPGADRAAAEELEIRITRAGGVRRLTLSGELTARTAPRLAECLDRVAAETVDRVVVDLSGLRVLEPVAVSPLLTAHLRAADDHRELVLIRGPTPVQRVLDGVEGPFRYLSGSRCDPHA